MDLIDELRALGCKVTFHASSAPGGLRFQIEGTADYTPAFANQVAEVFKRHGYVEAREGLWAPAGATEQDIHDTVKEMGEAAEYNRQAHEVIALSAEHPDWSDYEIATELGIDLNDVIRFRS